MENMNVKKLLAVLFIASVAITGCATQHDVKRARQDADEAKRMASMALDRVQQTDTRSQETQEMINRSYKKSMYK